MIPFTICLTNSHYYKVEISLHPKIGYLLENVYNHYWKLLNFIYKWQKMPSILGKKKPSFASTWWKQNNLHCFIECWIFVLWLENSLLVRRNSGDEQDSMLSCISHTENSLKKITLVNCLIIIILLLVVAANINEGKNYFLWIICMPTLRICIVTKLGSDLKERVWNT